MSPRDRVQRHSAITGASQQTHAQATALSTGPCGSSVANACSDAHSAGMSKIDGCPECVTNTEAPRSAVPVEGAWRCGYLCADCGHAWTTDWRD